MLHETLQSARAGDSCLVFFRDEEEIDQDETPMLTKCQPLEVPGSKRYNVLQVLMLQDRTKR